MADAKTETGPSLSLDKIYLKDASFEAPGAPQTLRGSVLDLAFSKDKEQ
ncbi:MAG: hypothetical protein AAB252_07395 [Pseudomonadota bacterium]